MALNKKPWSEHRRVSSFKPMFRIFAGMAQHVMNLDHKVWSDFLLIQSLLCQAGTGLHGSTFCGSTDGMKMHAKNWLFTGYYYTSEKDVYAHRTKESSRIYDFAGLKSRNIVT